MQADYRPRLSIVLDEDVFIELNKLIGDLRIKNALYAKITDDLINTMHKLDPEYRRLFLVAIIEGTIPPEEYLSSVRRINNTKDTK